MNQPKPSTPNVEAWTSRRPGDLPLTKLTTAERRAMDARMHELLQEFHARLAEAVSHD
jgi:hypothetical protein